MRVALPAPGTVRLNDGPFLNAQLLDKEYLLGLDPKRLLAPFFREAGLPKEAEPYGNWESQGLDGHSAGHYLSATSLMFAYTGDARFRDRAEEVVAGLARAQRTLGTGYVGGVPRSSELWAEVAAGHIDSATFTQDGRWVPWYNVHKAFAGLIEAHRSARIDGALETVGRMADWWLEIAAGIDDSAFELMLDTEFGGMNESFADLAMITGRKDYIAMAKRFSHRAILEPLAAGQDRLSGLHANTQVQKVVGYQRLAELTGDRDCATAASFFFDTVVNRRTVSIGGHGVREHFHAADDFHTMFEDREGPESCNSYNMMRLAGDLYAATGEPKYIDYIERTLHNHVLSAQHPVHGGFVYFTPMRPDHYRVYSQTKSSFWCCVGTGMEAHARHAAYIFAERDDRLAINLFINSTIAWRGITLTQHVSTAPNFGTEVTIHTDGPVHRIIDVRVPAWVDGAPEVTMNGERIAASSAARYLTLDREWAEGDTFSITLPASPRLEWLPCGSDWVSVAWGPTVYAATGQSTDLPDLVAGAGRMSHIARGSLKPLSQTPIVVESDPRRALIGEADGSVILNTAIGAVTLVPFSQVHDTRYTIYFPAGENADSRLQQLQGRDEWQLGTDARTQDLITLGEQQPEADHGFRGEFSENGRDGDTAWRRTSTSMSATLVDWRRAARSLRLSWLDGDGNVGYEIFANGIRVATIVREGGDISPIVYTEEYDLPSELLTMELERVQISVRACDDRRTDRITELRLLAESLESTGSS
ncbi:MAG: beta-L-arabinofuranosidase domain-containing protein [Microbacteriaceae bacterium]